MAPPPPHFGQSPHAASTPPPHFGQPHHFQEMQPQQPNYLMNLPHDASSTLYVEGLPPDATEREVTHIFRRFEGQGYQSLRMVARESSKSPGRNLYLCFVEFDNAHQATVAMHQLQGYRLEKGSDLPGVKISYAKSKSERRAPAPRSAPPPARPQGRPDGGRPDERYESQPYEGPPGGQYAESNYPRAHRRVDDREHSDSFRDDYEDSERGDDDLFQRADEVSMQGITDL